MNMAVISLTQLKDKNLSILIHLHPDLRSHQLLRQQIQLPKKSLKSSMKMINTRLNMKQNYNCTSHYHMNLGKAYAFLFGQRTTGLQHRIEAKAKYKSKIKGDPIKLLEMIKENSLSFDDKKKADIVTINAIMNLMTRRQKDNEDLTEYTMHFKVARDLCKEKYGGIFKIPTLTRNESTWGSDQETSYKTAYASFISILYLKNTDQTKYSSFIKKMAEDFATGQENVYHPHQGCTTCFVHPQV